MCMCVGVGWCGVVSYDVGVHRTGEKMNGVINCVKNTGKIFP